MSKLETSCGIPIMNKSSTVKAQPKLKGYFQKVFDDLSKDKKFIENFKGTVLISGMFLFTIISGLIFDFCTKYFKFGRDEPFILDMMFGTVASIIALVVIGIIIAPVIDVLFFMLMRVIKAFKNAAND